MSLRRSLGALALAATLTGLSGCSDITGSGDATIIVQNNATASVKEIFIAVCDAVTWGNDRLGVNETIAPGAEREFLVDSGCWDLRATFFDGTSAEDFGVRLDEDDVFTWELID